MRMLCKFGLAVFMIGTSVTAYAQTLVQLQEQWRAINTMPPPRKFDQLIPQLLAYRERAGGKSWQLHYMLGSSYCRTGQEKKGKLALYRVLGSYGLPDAARVAAQTVISNCGGQSATVEEPSFTFVPVSGQVGGVVHGKGGFEVDMRSESRSSKLQASPVAVDELQRRVFLPTHSGEAVKAVGARDENPSARVASVDGFVISSSLGLLPEEIGGCLARYRHPLESQFKMESPVALITVYAVRPERVPKYAERLHGVYLPLGTVAYSVYEDLSIVGIASSRDCGSLAHELVHLSIRQNFGDSPAWLEEGLASEVAVATPAQNAFHFNESWRDDVLHRHWDLRPSVSELLSKTWADYAANDMSQVNRVAALQAMAAVFIRYLDAKHKLVPVYFAIRDSLSSSDLRSDEEILKSHLSMSLDDVNADFVRWFKEPSKPSTYSSLDGKAAPRSLMECDDSLWNRGLNERALTVKDKCIAVTGTIVDATKGIENDGMRRERNGNARGWLKPDTEFKNLLNDGNVNLEEGNLVFQVVCNFPMTQSDPDPGCANYRSSMNIPPIGSHVRVVGAYVQHTSHGSWMEIHPVTSMTVIP